MSHSLIMDALPQERIYFGHSVRDALGLEVDRLGAQRVFLAASKTLRRETGAISLLVTTLGAKCVGIFDGIAEHSKLDGVAAAAAAAQASKADLLVGVGGGSIIDGLKIVQLALANNVTSVNDILALRKARTIPLHAIRQIAIPTTLSGAEVTPAGGGTDSGRGVKIGFIDPQLVPRSVIYDPAMGALTAEWLWLSSAIRGVDHCCEGILARNANPVADAGLLHALKLFSTTLRRTKTVPGDPFARSSSQIASYLACTSSIRAGSGASHGIGYILGGRYGVHHGYASCIMLPHVLRWNSPSTEDRQKLISIAMNRPDLSAGDAVAGLVSDLGLPTRLRDVGIAEKDLGAIAAEAATHPVVLSNPRPITRTEDVLEIVTSAW
ncbi:MAG: iron-containing alcohol dehydrogenase [Micropepsaceae bacterium]